MNADVVRHYANGLRDVPGFDAAAFERDALDDLEALELTPRLRHVTAVLHRHLGGDYLTGLSALLGMLETQEASDGPAFHFAHWPMAVFVAEYGLDHFDASVAAMRRITRYFSCEFAVRPFLVRYPDAMMAAMHDWAADPDVHVRRNASEGVRPRLPWGMRLQAFVEDPSPLWPLLAKLRKDPEAYVRRSVSNCLNDVAKDHPEALMDVLEQWDADPDAHTLWIKTRALRSLVKAGDPRALALLGFGPPQVRVEDLAIDRGAYTVGDTLTLSFAIVSTTDVPQQLVLDYRVHFVKKNGSRTAKVFKLKTLTLQPGERHEVVRAQHLKPISTRRYHPGTHAVDVQINGVAFSPVSFELAV
jgi:3-methyladenine DNA glycosylase AlkC